MLSCLEYSNTAKTQNASNLEKEKPNVTHLIRKLCLPFMT